MRTLAQRTKYTYNIFFSISFLPKKKNVSNCPTRQVLNNFEEENKLQKLEDALVKQMLTAADRADQA